MSRVSGVWITYDSVLNDRDCCLLTCARVFARVFTVSRNDLCTRPVVRLDSMLLSAVNATYAYCHTM